MKELAVAAVKWVTFISVVTPLAVGWLVALCFITYNTINAVARFFGAQLV